MSQETPESPPKIPVGALSLILFLIIAAVFLLEWLVNQFW
jgi:flagellar biogenesis protein FliO